MIKHWYFLFLILVTLSVSCEKDSISSSNTTSSNYLKADISGSEFVVYEDSSLNNDTIPNTFRFDFGQSVTNKTDTCFFLSACLNGQSLFISFPRPTECVTFDIYCNANTRGQPSAFYSLVADSDSKNGLVTFYTQNVSNSESIEGQRIGRVDIDIIDNESREVKGRFNFAAYGHEVSENEALILAGSLVIVMNGEFYYKWKESLDI